MKKAGWKRKIKKAVEDAGLYQPYFDLAIEQLAQILEIRDDAAAQYKASGSHPVVGYTTRGGNTNLKKNPALTVMQECTQQALAYWKELGLTPQGFKRIAGEDMQTTKKEATFEELLLNIGA